MRYLPSPSEIRRTHPLYQARAATCRGSFSPFPLPFRFPSALRDPCHRRRNATRDDRCGRPIPCFVGDRRRDKDASTRVRADRDTRWSSPCGRLKREPPQHRTRREVAPLHDHRSPLFHPSLVTLPVEVFCERTRRRWQSTTIDHHHSRRSTD